MLEMAYRYGEALFSLAGEKDKISTWQKEIKIIKELFIDNPKFLDILKSNFISLEERKSILDNTFKDVDIEIISFLKVIIDNNRVNEIFDILDAFNSLCNEHFGVLEGIVYSIEPLSKDIILELNETLSEKEGVSVELKNHIDKSLIGGLKIVINNRIYDDSIKNHLEKMKHTLLK